MNNLDWNWFFSSFSQSAAALLGIIAAFLISRLIGLNERIDKTISDFESLQIEFHNIKERFSIRYFDWYCKQLIATSSKIENAVTKGEFEKLDDQSILNKLYELETRLFKADDLILKEFKTKHKNLNNRSNSVLGYMPQIIPTSNYKDIETEQEAINQLQIQAKTIILQFQKNRNDISCYLKTITSCKIIIFVLLISFPITVIYPLHFMPLPVSKPPVLSFSFDVIISNIFSFKGILLILFFAAIESIIGYFLIMSNDAKKKVNNALQQYIDFNYSDIKNYSSYLG